jgi:UDP-N-acetylmuramoylalanine--D-glutamate ligase
MIDLSSFKGQKFAVMGLGKSGLATARALVAGGAEVVAWDDGEAGRSAAAAAGLTVAPLADLSGFEAMILSPGIPHTYPEPHPVAAAAKEAGLPIIGDIELLSQAYRQAAFIGITGTNGKSTTTALIAHILAQDTAPMAVGGNLGTPVVELDGLGAGGRYVLELSSYQLELAPSLTCRVAVLLNFSPDHLDRHGGMQGYIGAKMRIFKNQRPSDIAIIGVDDDHARFAFTVVADTHRQRVIAVSGQQPLAGGVYVDNGVLFDDMQDKDLRVMDMAEAPALPGSHNFQNAAAAYATCRVLGLDRAMIVAGLKSFPGLPHRQQRVAEVAGISFVNDSKATNPDAACRALACYEPIYWIAGGRAKEGASLEPMEPHLSRVAKAFLIGEAEEQFAGWLTQKGIAFERCGTLARATKAAFAAAKGDGKANATILLSPACASWDQFRSFEHRGDTFTALARTLAEGKAA